MGKNFKHQNASVLWIERCLSVLCLFSLLLAGCKPSNPSPIAVVTQAIQKTEVAMPPTATQAAPTAIPSPPLTASPAPTDTQTPTPTFTSSPSPSPTPAPKPILVDDWKTASFVLVSTGCKFEDFPCWRTVTNREKEKMHESQSWGAGNVGSTHVGAAAQTNQSSLTSKASITIDPSWKSPYLVYWFDNQVRGDIRVIAKIDQEAQASIWETLARHTFTGQNTSNLQWEMEAIDLSRYKGQKIWISFSAEIILPPPTNNMLAVMQWHLQKILIVPDFQAGMVDQLSALKLSELTGAP